MENTEQKNYMESNLKILKFAVSKWKLLLVVATIALIFSAVFSSASFIPPKYTSEAVIYPANIGEYGGETEIEQMQQYLESNDIRDYIISKFNLYDEYEIDSAGKSSKTYVKQAYSEHITFDETRFESIKIIATSTDPVKARDIVAEIIEQLNLTIRTTQQEKYQEIVDINKQMLDQKKYQIDSLEKKMQEMSVKYGILDLTTQSERVTEKYMDFLLSGKKGPDFEEAKTLYENLQKYGRIYHDYYAQLNMHNQEYIERLNDYELSYRDLNKVQTYSNILVKPEIPDKKSYPIRWFIVLSAVVGALGFTFVLLLIFGFQNKED